MAILSFSNALHLNMSKKGANGNLKQEKVCRQIKSAPLGFHQAERFSIHPGLRGAIITLFTQLYLAPQLCAIWQRGGNAIEGLPALIRFPRLRLRFDQCVHRYRPYKPRSCLGCFPVRRPY